MSNASECLCKWNIFRWSSLTYILAMHLYASLPRVRKENKVVFRLPVRKQFLPQKNKQLSIYSILCICRLTKPKMSTWCQFCIKLLPKRLGSMSCFQDFSRGFVRYSNKLVTFGKSACYRSRWGPFFFFTGYKIILSKVKKSTYKCL